MSYAIGVAEPLSIFVSSYGTGVKSDEDLLKIVQTNFDLRPGVIVRFDLMGKCGCLCGEWEEVWEEV